MLSEALGVSPIKIAGYISLFEKDKHSILFEASELWNEFDDANITERAKMLGFTISEPIDPNNN